MTRMILSLVVNLNSFSPLHGHLFVYFHSIDSTFNWLCSLTLFVTLKSSKKRNKKWFSEKQVWKRKLSLLVVECFCDSFKDNYLNCIVMRDMCLPFQSEIMKILEQKGWFIEINNFVYNRPTGGFRRVPSLRHLERQLQKMEQRVQGSQRGEDSNPQDFHSIRIQVRVQVNTNGTRCSVLNIKCCYGLEKK